MSDISPFPERGLGVAPHGQCGFGTSIENYCGAPATIHIIFKRDLSEAGIECDQHYEYAKKHWAFYAAHPFDPDCCIRGAQYDRMNNRCFSPEDTSWWDAVEMWLGAPEGNPASQ